ncbi:hypothetical protein OKW98_05580 [Pseudomonas sp. KU26590]|uniref:hypothetical protein n=1 Tax=Pseudomonas sp. KU26590 TaxID=2991051 RepID=UPI00223DFB26|nr:hypothetical protein [Pseudomonas sp. KU26590]UZJ61194.1 hypothetical protein OKW98_05580 [Pseudomonas sp. KU26590]
MSCYYCEKPATGMEHVPPQSFFIKGQRDGLISVPSCDVHNQQKSKDDEYVRAVLLSSAKLDGKEQLAPLFEVHLRALNRAGEQIPGRLKSEEDFQKFLEIAEKFKDDHAAGMKSFSELAQAGIGTGLLGLLSVDYRDEVIFDNDGNEQQTISYAFDTKRFNNFFKSMAKGLFFHESDWAWLGKVVLLPHSFLREEASEDEKFISKHYSSQLVRDDAKGEHKDVFYYDVGTELDSSGKEILRYVVNFCLYDTFEFTALLESKYFVASPEPR